MKNYILFALLLIFSCCGSEPTTDQRSNLQKDQTDQKSLKTIETPADPSEEAIAVPLPTKVEEVKFEEHPEISTPREKPSSIPAKEKQEKVIKEEKIATTKTVDNIPEKEEVETSSNKVNTKLPTTTSTTPVVPEPTNVNTTPTKENSSKANPSSKNEIAPSPPSTKEEVKVPSKITTADHGTFDGLLKKYVSNNGNVNYKGFKNSESELDDYLAYLSTIKVNDLLGRNEKMAFYINSYNAFTIKLILKNYPLSSITNLDGGKPWDVKWIKLDGKTVSLNAIENDILRPVFKDARIHFAVNCAARSCPPLLNGAWTAANLESNFQKQTKKFINDSNYNSISKKKVMISKIFEWYGKDFGNLVNFLNKYSNSEINSNAKIEFMEYDWSLNE